MAGFPDVVVVGAGPYGLSVAAHLRARGVDHRIFGQPMEFWDRRTPRGMLLKSDAYASNLSSLAPPFTLRDFHRERRMTYADEGIPVPCATFVEYGREFRQRFVPHSEPAQVVALGRTARGYSVRLDTGEILATRKVVVAVGIGGFGHVPEMLGPLPAELVSHSSAHHDLSPFSGREICVLGGGASAVCTSALLHEAGASVKLVARTLQFHGRTPLRGRSLWERVRRPHSGVGSGWRSAFFAHAPLAFHALPEPLRLRAVRNANGPAGGWSMKDRVIGQFSIFEGWQPRAARERAGKVELEVADRTGAKRTLSADHVFAATGYRISLDRLDFLAKEIREHLRTSSGTPALSANFESRLPGLYFVGPIAKDAFGPMMRFVYGAHLASLRTARHIERRVQRGLVPGQMIVAVG